MIRDEIIKARKIKRVNTKTLASWAGCSASLLYKYEKGYTNLSEDTLNKIIKVLELRIILIDKN